jgi:hypothetical protein
MFNQVNKLLYENRALLNRVQSPFIMCDNLNVMFGGNIRFVVEMNSELDIDQLFIGGLYSPEKKRPILIKLSINPKTTVIDIPDMWPSLVFLLSQTIKHELIHHYQHSQRDDDFYRQYHYYSEAYEKGDERNYLSSYDEVEAYAHDIAFEMLYYYGYDKSIELLKKPRRIKKSRTLSMYRKAFSNVNWSITKKVLLLKVYKWLPNADPYKEPNDNT